MYGQPQIERSSEMRRADDEFIARAVEGFGGSRERASDVWWAEGERFMSERNFDYAMRRYNQAWLLNPRSFRPYWGFARILLECDQFAESQTHFAKAIELVDDRYQEPAVLTDAANGLVFAARSAPDDDAKKIAFAKADDLYKRALLVDPEYGNAYKRYAMSLYFQGAYADAWKYLREAQKRRNVDIPPAFLRDLKRAMPEPAS